MTIIFNYKINNEIILGCDTDFTAAYLEASNNYGLSKKEICVELTVVSINQINTLFVRLYQKIFYGIRND